MPFRSSVSNLNIIILHNVTFWFSVQLSGSEKMH